MERRKIIKIYTGGILLLLLIAMNVFIAIKYYYLDSRKLPQFFIWQTNIEAKDAKK